MRFKPAQNEHLGVVNARSLESLQTEPSQNEPTGIKQLSEHVVTDKKAGTVRQTRTSRKSKQRFDQEYVYSVYVHYPVMENSTSLR